VPVEGVKERTFPSTAPMFVGVGRVAMMKSAETPALSAAARRARDGKCIVVCCKVLRKCVE
jgi:hypothetical protein